MENNEDNSFKCASCGASNVPLRIGGNDPIICGNCLTKDKRQMTVIAAEIERQKTRKIKIERLCSNCADNLLRNFYKGSIAELNEIINSLESLLPKEREMIESAYNDGIKMGESYIPHHGYDNYIDSEQWFSQTYTQDYKTK